MYDPNVCTPTMFEDELNALSSMSAFTDPEIDSRLQAVAELRRAIQAVREIPGWSGDSVGEAQVLLERMEKGATTIETALTGMRSDLRAASDTAAGAASAALRRLPSASAEGFLADAGRNLSGLTDGWGAFDTGEAVAREEARLAAERETAAMNELKTIRSTLAGEARQNFTDPGRVTVNPSSVPLPSIDVDAIDARVPAVGSNAPSSSGGGAPSAGGGYPQGGAGIGSWNPPTGTWVPDGNGGGDGSGNGNGNGNGDGGSGGDGGTGGIGTDDPSVDSPGGGILPGYPGGGLGGGGLGGGGGAGGGLLPGGGSGGLGAAVVGGAGAAAMLGARSASLNTAGGAGLFGGGTGTGTGAGAATAGRGLLGMSGATGPGGMGAMGSASGSASGSAGGSAAGAGGRTMAPGMMGGGAGDDEKRERSGLGGPIAPKLEEDEEVGPRSRSAQAGSRDALD